MNKLDSYHSQVKDMESSISDMDQANQYVSLNLSNNSTLKDIKDSLTRLDFSSLGDLRNEYQMRFNNHFLCERMQQVLQDLGQSPETVASNISLKLQTKIPQTIELYLSQIETILKKFESQAAVFTTVSAEYLHSKYCTERAKKHRRAADLCSS